MTPESLAAVFGVRADTVTELDTGHINRTCLVTSGSGRYILQSLNPAVFTSPGKVENNLSEVIRCLRSAKDISVPEYLSAPEGGLFLRSDEAVWRMYRYAEGGVSAKEALFCTGYSCGAFMRTLGDGKPLLDTAIDGFHDISHHFRQMTDALRDSAVSAETKGISDFLTGWYSRVYEVFRGLPLRPIHGDAKGDNFVLTGVPEKGTAIDLDNVMYSYAAVDYGDLIRSLAGAGDIPAAEQLTEGFAAGLGGALSAEEERSLYDGVIYVTAELAIRYLTDYLRGAVFFRSKTPEQCLERTRQLCVQLRAFEACEEQFRSMTERCFRKG